MGPCIPELCGLMAMLAAYLSCVVLRPCWGRSAALIPYAGQWHHWSLGVGIEGGGAQPGASCLVLLPWHPLRDRRSGSGTEGAAFAVWVSAAC